MAKLGAEGATITEPRKLLSEWLRKQRKGEVPDGAADDDHL